MHECMIENIYYIYNRAPLRLHSRQGVGGENSRKEGVVFARFTTKSSCVYSYADEHFNHCDYNNNHKHSIFSYVFCIMLLFWCVYKRLAISEYRIDRNTFVLEELFLDRGAVIGGHDGCQRQVVTAFTLRQLVLCADGWTEVFWLRSAP